MKNVFDTLHRAPSHIQLRQIPVNELDLRQMRKVLALACDQAVDDTDVFTAANELFAQVRSNETGTAGDEIVRHGVVTVGSQCERDLE